MVGSAAHDAAKRSRVGRQARYQHCWPFSCRPPSEPGVRGFLAPGSPVTYCVGVAVGCPEWIDLWQSWQTHEGFASTFAMSAAPLGLWPSRCGEVASLRTLMGFHSALCLQSSHLPFDEPFNQFDSAVAVGTGLPIVEDRPFCSAAGGCRRIARWRVCVLCVSTETWKHFVARAVSGWWFGISPPLSTPTELYLQANVFSMEVTMTHLRRLNSRRHRPSG